MTTSHDSDTDSTASTQNDPNAANTTSSSTRNTKRVRVNHNEIERKRRNAQKERLDELRRAVPVLAGQERASTVSIIVRAKEYIDVLKGRVMELERFVARVQASGAGARPGQPVPSIQPQQPQQVQASKPQKQVPGFTPIAPYPLNSALLLAEAASSLPAIERPINLSSTSDAVRKSSSSGEDFLALLQARKSSLILPADDAVYFGKRSDSIHAFLHSGLSSVLEESVQADIRCAKCSRGINSLIMVDCDQCHAWYHIRCVGLEAAHIPVTWRCAECKLR